MWNSLLITPIVNNACDEETTRLLENREKKNIFLGICQLFMNIASSRVIQWIPTKQKFLATESDTFKHPIREEIEIRLRKPSLNRDKGFELASA